MVAKGCIPGGIPSWIPSWIPSCLSPSHPAGAMASLLSLQEENRILQQELSRVEDLLAQSRAERDELAIKYNALSERVSPPKSAFLAPKPGRCQLQPRRSLCGAGGLRCPRGGNCPDPSWLAGACPTGCTERRRPSLLYLSRWFSGRSPPSLWESFGFSALCPGNREFKGALALPVPSAAPGETQTEGPVGILEYSGGNPSVCASLFKIKKKRISGKYPQASFQCCTQGPFIHQPLRADWEGALLNPQTGS